MFRYMSASRISEISDSAFGSCCFFKFEVSGKGSEPIFLRVWSRYEVGSRISETWVLVTGQIEVF